MPSSRTGDADAAAVDAPTSSEHPLPGDANSDGFADGDDFLSWQRNLGATRTATAAQGDADRDGDVDQYDLQTWRTNFGMTASQAVAAQLTVPGDYNSDASVNAADLSVWRQHFGTISGATTGQGDADRDGDVDGDDFLTWQRHLGNDAPLAVRVADPIASRDDGDWGYNERGVWQTGTLPGGWQGDYRVQTPGSGSRSAEWVTILPAGQYEVFATWPADASHATDAKFQIIDGATSLATPVRDQSASPIDATFDGRMWESLGTYSFATGVPTIRLTNDASGLVVADGVLFVPKGDCPFDDNLTGWRVLEDGGTPTGHGGADSINCAAVLSEGDSFRTSMEQTFVVPAGSTSLSFRYDGLNFDTTDTDFINDAFEVALVDQTGASLVPTFSGDFSRDAFFNASEGLAPALGQGTTLTSGVVTVSLNGVAAGTQARLLFRLANNDQDSGTNVRIVDVAFSIGASPIPENSSAKFFVVDATADEVFRYSEAGNELGDFISSPVLGNARGIASSADGSVIWTIDGTTRRVHVQGPDGTSLGSWRTSGIATPQGITVHGSDVWIVDSALDRVFLFVGAATRRTGEAAPTSSFALNVANTSPSDLVTDGTNIWVTDDVADAVFVYSLTGALQGSWTLDSANADASGITLDPSGSVADLWTVDRVERRVYRYANAQGRTSGMQSAADSFALVIGNVGPEGIADPPLPTDGSVIAIGDEWVLSDAAFSQQPAQTNQLLENITTYFTGGRPGNFLAASNLGPTGDGPRGVTGQALADAIESLGHSWTVDPAPSFTPESLSQFDAVFLAGPVGSGAANAQALINYVHSGGSIVVMAGTGNVGDAASEAIAWNTFLSEFGIGFAPTWYTPFSLGSVPVVASFHPLSASLESVIWGYGQSVLDLDPVDDVNQVVVRGDFTDEGGPFGRINDIVAVYNVPSDTEGLPGAPSITVQSPASSVAVGTQLVLAGFASASAAINPSPNSIVSVTNNESAVDVLDVSGRFFSQVEIRPGSNAFTFIASDAFGRQASTRVTIEGRLNDAVDFSRYADISGSFSGVYGRTSFNDDTDTMLVELATRNDGTFATDVPLLVGVKNLRERGSQRPTVEVVGADGVTPDGIPYFDFSDFVRNNRLGPGEVTGSPVISFHNPNRARFDYELVFYGKLNAPPTITSVPGVEALIGRPYVYQVTATDEDGDALTYRLSEAPADMEIDSATGRMAWTPAMSDVGNHTIVVQVDDGRGGTSELHYTLSVIEAPPNRPPVITSRPNTLATVLHYANPANEQGFTPVEITPSDIASALSDRFSVLPTVTPTQFGFADLAQRVDFDRTSNGTPIPSGVQLDNRYADLGVEFRNVPTADNVYGGPASAPNATFISDGVSEIYFTIPVLAAGFINTSPDQDFVRYYSPQGELLFETQDQQGQSSYNFDVDRFVGARSNTLRPIGSIRIDNNIGNLELDELIFEVADGDALESYYVYQVSSVDPDGDHLTYSLAAFPDGMRIHSASGLITWAPTLSQVGNHAVKVEVTDARGGVATQEFVVCVEPDPNNHAPIIISDPNTTVLIDAIYNYDVAAIDPNGDALTYSLLSGPAGMTIDPPSGLITWNPSAQQNLLVNGGFEQVPTPPTFGQGELPIGWHHAGNISPGGDTFSGTGDYGVSPGAFGWFTTTTPLEGVRWVAAAQFGIGGSIEAIGQQLESPLATGHRYRISGNLLQGSGTGSYQVLLSPTATLSSSSVVVGEFAPTTGSALWEYRTFDFVAPTGSDELPYLILAAKSLDASHSYIALDDVSLIELEEDAASVTVRAADGRGGFDEQSFIIVVNEAGTGAIRGAKWNDVSENGIWDYTLLVSGFDSHNVVRFDGQSGQYLGDFVPSGYGGLSQAEDLLVLSDGSVLVASFGSNELLRFDGESGTFLETFASIGSPTGMAIGSDGLLYVSSYFDNKISRFRLSDGAFVDDFIPAGAGGLARPHGVVFGPDGHLYVSDNLNNNVLRYAAGSGAFMGIFASGAGLRQPTGLTFGPDGHLYVAGDFSHNVIRFDGRTGEFIDEFVTAEPAESRNTHDVSFSPDGRLLFVGRFGTNDVRSYDGRTGELIRMFAAADSLAGVTYFTFDGEDGLANWTIYLDQNDNGRRDVGESWTTTDANGRYEFTGLPPGTYTVREEPQPGWRQTFPGAMVPGRFWGLSFDSKLLQIDSQTGLAVRLRDFGTNFSDALAVDEDGVVYVIANRNQLKKLNPRTGAFVDVGAVAGFVDVEELTFRDGVLYAAASANDDQSAEQLIEIDKHSATARGIAIFGPGFSDVDALATAPDGSFIGADLGTGEIFRFDLTTQSSTTLHQTGYHFVAFAFDAAETLFATTSPSTSVGLSDLVTIDLTTGVVSRVGGTNELAIGGLAIEPPLARDGRHVVQIFSNEAVSGVDFGNVRTAESSNANPQFQSAPPATAVFGALYRYDAFAVDPDNDPLSFALVTGPAGMTLNPQTGTLVWQPKESQLGQHTVVLRVTDSRGGVDVQRFDLAVAAPNTPPVFTSTPPAQAMQGRQLVYDIAVQDADGDLLTVSLGAGSAGALVAQPATGPNGEPLQTRYRFEWTPTAADLASGTRTVTLVASDGRGGVAEQPFVVAVTATAPNARPEILSVPRTVAYPGVPYAYAVLAHDGNGDALTYTLTTKPEGMAISANGVITWTPPSNATGSHAVRVVVNDGIDSVVQELSLRIASQAENTAPRITSNPPQSARHDKAYAYDAHAVDAEGDPVRWSLEAAPIGMSINAEIGAIRWTPREDQIGSHQVVLRATDPFGAATVQSFAIEVACVNTPPLILSTPPTQASVGEAYFYGVRAVDPEGDALTYSLPGAPSGMTITANGLIRWTPEAADEGQTRSVVVRIEDSDGGFAVQEYGIAVMAATNVNRPPVITSTPNFAATLDELYEYLAAATDADGDTLVYSLPAKPGWLSVDSATGRLFGTPTAAGVESVVLQVSDDQAVATQGFAISVRANQTPTIQSTPNLAADAGGAYRYSVRASDPDGDALSYSLLNGPAGMTIDGFGRITWSVPADFVVGLPAGVSRSADVAIRVSDPRGAEALQPFTILVAPDTQAPRVGLEIQVDNRIFPTHAEVDLGASATIRVTAVDNVGVTARSLTVDGIAVPLDATGRAVISASLLGFVTLAATAIDAAGNEGSASGTLTIVDPADRNRPIRPGAPPNDPTRPPHPGFDPSDSQGVDVTITSPEFNAPVTTVTPIVGTIDDPENNLWYWRAYAVRADLVDLAQIDLSDPDLIQIAQGTNEVHNAEIAKFDPSTFASDPYAILVAAFDVNGRGSIATTVVTVEGNVKLGQFRLEFSDLTIPLAGIPIQITRVYDTHNASTHGDFGYGWTLGVRDARIVEVGAIGDGGAFNPGANTFVPGKTKVYLTNPSGQRVAFTYQERLTTGTFFGAILEPYFTPDPGVYDKLTIDETQVFRGGILGAVGEEGVNPSVYTLTTSDGTQYRYDQSAGLQKITDLNGNTVSFTAAGATHSSGVEVKFVRDGRGRITEIVDPSGNKLRYSYNAAGDLASFTSQEQLTTTFKYHARAAHYLDEIIDPLGRRAVKTEYDDAGRILRVIDAEGNEVEYDHSLEGFERVRDAAGNWTSLKYDAFGNVTEERRGEHTVTLPGGGQQTAYDSIVRTRYIHERDGVASPNRDKEWQVTQVFLDDLGATLKEVTTEYDYDARGNVTRVTDVVGDQTLVREFSYDAKSNVTRVKDELGRQTFFAYDAAGNLSEVVNAEGNKATTIFDSQGRVTGYTDFNGNTTSFVYSGSQSQPSEIRNPGHTDATPNVRRFEYNALGQTTKITDEEGIVTVYEYDAQGRLVYERVGTDAPVRSVYQGNNLFKRIVARSEVSPVETDIVTEYGYYANDLLRYEIDALGAVTGYEYDANGNRTFLGRWNTMADYDADYAAQAASPATIFAGRYPKATFEHVFVYDRLNRLDYEVDDVQLALAEQAGVAISQITVRLDYDYDSAGNRTEVVDRNGRKRTFQYDEWNRMVAELWWQLDATSGQNEVIRSFTWQYCTCGNVSLATEYEGPAGAAPILSQYAYTYDLLGRLTSVDNAGTQDMPHVVLSYAYDANGNQTRVEDSLGVAVVSTYDAQNRLKTRAWDNAPGIAAADAVDEVLVEFDYYRNGTQKELRRYDLNETTGARTLVGRTLHGNLDASGRVQTISHRDAVDQAIAEYTYGFDKLGLVKSLRYDNRDNEYDFEVEYRYDDLGQLTDADYTDATTARGIYQDEFYRYDKNGNRTRAHLHSNGYMTGAGNRLLSDGIFSYMYDNVGNLVRKTEIASGEVTIFEYDYRNLLTRATRFSQQPESGGVIVSESMNRYDIDGRRIEFVLDGDGEGSEASLQTRVIHNGDDTWADFHVGGEVATRYLLGTNIDEMIARWQNTNEVPEGLSWYLTDRLSTVGDMTGPADTPREHISYGAFGSVQQARDFHPANRFLFTGRELEFDLSSYYYRARRYDSVLGRFLSNDPVGFIDGSNTFLYAKNNPVHGTDPTGTTAIYAYALVGATIGFLGAGALGSKCPLVPGAIGFVTPYIVGTSGPVIVIISATLFGVVAGLYLDHFFTDYVVERLGLSPCQKELIYGFVGSKSG